MPRPLFVALALGLVYILWGSTAPAIKLAVTSIPPWWMAAIRFATAGSLLWTWCRLRGIGLPRADEWRAAALTGTILLAFSNGVFSWTEQFLPSGIGSLFFALSPLWMAVFAFALDGERPSPVAAIGLALGLGGMIYLYSPSGGQGLPAWPTVVGIFTSVTWALGSVVQRRFRATDVVQMSAMQMLVAAGVLGGFALVTREPLAPAAFTPTALGALAYLVIFGSIVGFSAFLWLMNNVPTTLASTYSYVNPIVALAIGIGLLHEAFSWRLAAGATVIVLGVAVMMLAPRGGEPLAVTEKGESEPRPRSRYDAPFTRRG